MGRNAVVIGSGTKDVTFSAPLLSGEAPSLGGRYVLEDAAEAETRSHGFFFQPDQGGLASGAIGLPVARPARPAFHQLFEESAAIVFLRYGGSGFAGLGELASHPEDARDDKCAASCVDWYGNARPIFLGGRVLALMGYELVEGRMDAGTVHEVARASFAPN